MVFPVTYRLTASKDRKRMKTVRLRPGAPCARHDPPTWQAASDYLLMYYPASSQVAESLFSMISLTTEPEWIEAKRRRFVSLEPVLSDLDQAHTSGPPRSADLRLAVRVCAVYTRFATVAPPLAIDVLAALGELGLAELMAKTSNSRSIAVTPSRCWPSGTPRRGMRPRHPTVSGWQSARRASCAGTSRRWPCIGSRTRRWRAG